MKINVSATQDGNEVAEALASKVAQDIPVKEGGYKVKCIVTNSKGDQVEIALDKVKFVFERK